MEHFKQLNDALTNHLLKSQNNLTSKKDLSHNSNDQNQQKNAQLNNLGDFLTDKKNPETGNDHKTNNPQEIQQKNTQLSNIGDFLTDKKNPETGNDHKTNTSQEILDILISNDEELFNELEEALFNELHKKKIEEIIDKLHTTAFRLNAISKVKNKEFHSLILKFSFSIESILNRFFNSEFFQHYMLLIDPTKVSNLQSLTVQNFTNYILKSDLEHRDRLDSLNIYYNNPFDRCKIRNNNLKVFIKRHNNDTHYITNLCTNLLSGFIPSIMAKISAITFEDSSLSVLKLIRLSFEYGLIVIDKQETMNVFSSYLLKLCQCLYEILRIWVVKFENRKEKLSRTYNKGKRLFANLISNHSNNNALLDEELQNIIEIHARCQKDIALIIIQQITLYYDNHFVEIFSDDGNILVREVIKNKTSFFGTKVMSDYSNLNDIQKLLPFYDKDFNHDILDIALNFLSDPIVGGCNKIGIYETKKAIEACLFSIVAEDGDFFINSLKMTTPLDLHFSQMEFDDRNKKIYAKKFRNLLLKLINHIKDEDFDQTGVLQQGFDIDIDNQKQGSNFNKKVSNFANIQSLNKEGKKSYWDKENKNKTEGEKYQTLTEIVAKIKNLIENMIIDDDEKTKTFKEGTSDYNHNHIKGEFVLYLSIENIPTQLLALLDNIGKFFDGYFVVNGRIANDAQTLILDLLFLQCKDNNLAKSQLFKKKGFKHLLNILSSCDLDMACFLIKLSHEHNIGGFIVGDIFQDIFDVYEITFSEVVNYFKIDSPIYQPRGSCRSWKNVKLTQVPLKEVLKSQLLSDKLIERQKNYGVEKNDEISTESRSKLNMNLTSEHFDIKEILKCIEPIKEEPEEEEAIEPKISHSSINIKPKVVIDYDVDYAEMTDNLGRSKERKSSLAKHHKEGGTKKHVHIQLDKNFKTNESDNSKMLTSKDFKGMSQFKNTPKTIVEEPIEGDEEQADKDTSTLEKNKCDFSFQESYSWDIIMKRGATQDMTFNRKISDTSDLSFFQNDTNIHKASGFSIDDIDIALPEEFTKKEDEDKNKDIFIERANKKLSLFNDDFNIGNPFDRNPNKNVPRLATNAEKNDFNTDASISNNDGANALKTVIGSMLHGKIGCQIGSQTSTSLKKSIAQSFAQFENPTGAIQTSYSKLGSQNTNQTPFKEKNLVDPSTQKVEFPFRKIMNDHFFKNSQSAIKISQNMTSLIDIKKSDEKDRIEWSTKEGNIINKDSIEKRFVFMIIMNNFFSRIFQKNFFNQELKIGCALSVQAMLAKNLGKVLIPKALQILNLELDNFRNGKEMDQAIPNYLFDIDNESQLVQTILQLDTGKTKIMNMQHKQLEQNVCSSTFSNMNQVSAEIYTKDTWSAVQDSCAQIRQYLYKYKTVDIPNYIYGQSENLIELLLTFCIVPKANLLMGRLPYFLLDNDKQVEKVKEEYKDELPDNWESLELIQEQMDIVKLNLQKEDPSDAIGFAQNILLPTCQKFTSSYMNFTDLNKRSNQILGIDELNKFTLNFKEIIHQTLLKYVFKYDDMENLKNSKLEQQKNFAGYHSGGTVKQWISQLNWNNITYDQNMDKCWLIGLMTNHCTQLSKQFNGYLRVLPEYTKKPSNFSDSKNKIKTDAHNITDTMSQSEFVDLMWASRFKDRKLDLHLPQNEQDKFRKKLMKKTKKLNGFIAAYYQQKKDYINSKTHGIVHYNKQNSNDVPLFFDLCQNNILNPNHIRRKLLKSRKFTSDNILIQDEINGNRFKNKDRFINFMQNPYAQYYMKYITLLCRENYQNIRLFAKWMCIDSYRHGDNSIGQGNDDDDEVSDISAIKLEFFSMFLRLSTDLVYYLTSKINCNETWWTMGNNYISINEFLKTLASSTQEKQENNTKILKFLSNIVPQIESNKYFNYNKLDLVSLKTKELYYVFKSSLIYKNRDTRLLQSDRQMRSLPLINSQLNCLNAYILGPYEPNIKIIINTTPHLYVYLSKLLTRTIDDIGHYFYYLQKDALLFILNICEGNTYKICHKFSTALPFSSLDAITVNIFKKIFIREHIKKGNQQPDLIKFIWKDFFKHVDDKGKLVQKDQYYELEHTSAENYHIKMVLMKLSKLIVIKEIGPNDTKALKSIGLYKYKDYYYYIHQIPAVVHDYYQIHDLAQLHEMFFCSNDFNQQNLWQIFFLTSKLGDIYSTLNKADRNMYKQLQQKIQKIRENHYEKNFQKVFLSDFINMVVDTSSGQNYMKEYELVFCFQSINIRQVEVISKKDNKDRLIRYLKDPACYFLSESIKYQYRQDCDISGQSIKLYDFLKFYNFFSANMKNELELYRKTNKYLYNITSRDSYYYYQLFLYFLVTVINFLQQFTLDIIGNTKLTDHENDDLKSITHALGFLVCLISLILLLTWFIFRLQASCCLQALKWELRNPGKSTYSLGYFMNTRFVIYSFSEPFVISALIHLTCSFLASVFDIWILYPPQLLLIYYYNRHAKILIKSIIVSFKFFISTWVMILLSCFTSALYIMTFFQNRKFNYDSYDNIDCTNFKNCLQYVIWYTEFLGGGITATMNVFDFGKSFSQDNLNIVLFDFVSKLYFESMLIGFIITVVFANLLEVNENELKRSMFVFVIKMQVMI